MRIFYAFIVMLCMAALFMLPVSPAIYDFRTDARTDTFRNVVTVPPETTADVTLIKAIYGADTETVSIVSDDTEDEPVVDSYVAATRVLTVGGLSGNSTRTLAVTYDVDALEVHTAVDALLDFIPTFWILTLVAFPVTALVAIFTGRA